MPKKLIVIKTW